MHIKYWWCMECQVEVGLDKHGRCEVCESEAVDLLFADDDLSRPVSVISTDSNPSPACA
jgi:Zn finger protein HypA/HybF involved in hydrogenase expression